MLMAHPAVLRDLIERYEDLQAQSAGGAEVRQPMDDVAYTLCVSTGTRNVEAAMAAARRQLAGAQGCGGSDVVGR
ncbi:DUF5133 domain-containing protein [Streptomyces radiopugnans]|uniref:DUF5133 domain-containing protein n=1 Tax=Streptomyces radiopugnans TaxID=403935 RepID=UPI003F1C44F5